MECVCPILGRPTPVEKTHFSHQSWTIVRCLETGFLFLPNPPSYHEVSTEFAWEKRYVEEQQRRNQQAPRLASLSKLVKRIKHRLGSKRGHFFSLAKRAIHTHAPDQPLHFLDIGCGWGNLNVELYNRFARRGRTVIPYGIELSPELANISGGEFAQRGGHVVFANALEGIEQFEPQSMDLVLLCSFLEHEPQPLELLQRLARLLKPGAAILLKVPNFDCWNRRLRDSHWCGFRFPDHVNYFTPPTLRLLAEQAGYRMTQGLWDRSPLSDNMYAVLTREN